MKTTAGAIVAAAVLVAGALIAVTVTPAGAGARVPEGERDLPAIERSRAERDGVLSGVLAALVADGTLDQAQADAVDTARRDAAAQRRPLRRAARRGAQAGYRLGRLLADDVIDADELLTLRDDHPLRDPDGPASAYLDDGRLTLDELRSIRAEWKSARRDDG